MDIKTETEIRRKADKGICYVRGCERPGKSRVQLTFAKRIEGKLTQILLNAWACDDYQHRGGR